MDIKRIEETADLLLQLQNIKTSQSEVGITENGKVVIIEKLNRAKQYLTSYSCYSDQKLSMEEKCKNNLQQRLIQLKITPNSKITAESLCPKLKDAIIAYYMQQGLTIDEIIELIDNCDNHLDTFKVLLETKLTSLEINDTNYNLQPINNQLDTNPQNLSHYLDLYITDANKKKSLLDSTLELAKDSEYITIETIYNNLQYEFNITEELQQGIIESLYGKKTASIFYNKKNNILLQQDLQDDALKLKYEKFSEDKHEIQRNKTLEKYKKDHQEFVKKYRTNGLELETKHSLVIGSKFVDKTGQKFNGETTVFADMVDADLNGDILNTIDTLHSERTNHNKFKYICFTHVPGFLFQTIDDSLSLMIKIYDILQPGGVVMISMGINCECRTINSNKSFIDRILIPANFSKNEIVTLDTHEIYQYKDCLDLLKKNNHILENYSRPGVALIARKLQLIS